MKLLNEFIDANFSTPSNTVGMGNMLMPTDTKPGSGDIPQGISIPIKYKIKNLKDKLKKNKHKLKSLKEYLNEDFDLSEGFKIGKTKAKSYAPDCIPQNDEELTDIVWRRYCDAHDTLGFGKDLVDLDFTDIDISKCKDLISLFDNYKTLRSIDLSGWDLSHVDKIGYMFADCIHLKSVNITGWDLSHMNANSIFKIFDNCKELEEIIGLEDINNPEIEEIFKEYIKK